MTIPDYVALKPGAYEWKLFPIVEERIVHKATLEGFRLKDSGDTTAKPN